MVAGGLTESLQNKKWLQNWFYKNGFGKWLQNYMKIYIYIFIQIKIISYYNVYILKLKLSINYSDLNITVTPHAEKEVCSQGKFDNTVHT